MARKVDPEVRETWRKRIRRQGQSGLTVAAFCNREGVSSARFYAWKRKLQASAPPPAVGRASALTAATPRRQRRKPSPSSGSAAFVQVPLPSTAGSPWIEVALPEGTVIRIPQQNLAAVRAVLGTLSGNGTWEGEEMRYA